MSSRVGSAEYICRDLNLNQGRKMNSIRRFFSFNFSFLFIFLFFSFRRMIEMPSRSASASAALRTESLFLTNKREMRQTHASVSLRRLFINYQPTTRDLTIMDFFFFFSNFISLVCVCVCMLDVALHVVVCFHF